MDEPDGLFGKYNPNNMFARILRGELPVSVFHEDRHVLALMALRMISKGHVLVISRTSRARNFLEIDSDDLGRINEVARRVACGQIRAFRNPGFQIKQNNGSAGTESVFHYHVHVVPQFEGIGFRAAELSEGTRRIGTLDPNIEGIAALRLRDESSGPITDLQMRGNILAPSVSGGYGGVAEWFKAPN